MKKKSLNSSEPPPEEPAAPVAVRHIVSDCTLEGLAPILQENPRGVLLDGDELGGWLGAFDRYAGGKGGVDAAAWRKVFDSNAITVDRKTGRQIIHVANPFVSMIGTIQPDALQRSLGVEHLESGMAARLLLAFPPAQPLMWSDADIPLDVERQYEVLLERLLALEQVVNGDGEPQPITLELDKPSRRRFVSWHDTHRTEQAEMKGVLAGHWSKLVTYCERFALLDHIVRQATSETTSKVIGLVSVDAAIKLVEWFGHEAKRCYAMVEESDEGRNRRRLVELIRRKGGLVTVRDLMRGSRRFVEALIAFHRAEPTVRQSNFLDGHPVRPGGLPDASWYNADGEPVDWTADERSLTCLLGAMSPNGVLKPPNHHVLIMFNAGADPRRFTIPPIARALAWRQFIDTAADTPADIYPDLDGPAPPADGLLEPAGRSLVCYVAPDEL